MKATFVFVPPGGGEADYSLDFDIPAVPQPGDYIEMKRAGREDGLSSFIVRRTWWYLDYPEPYDPYSQKTEVTGSTGGVMVECEYAIGRHDSEAHKRSCESEAIGAKGPLQRFEDTAF